MNRTKVGPQAALKLDSFLCFAVYSVNHAFNRVYKPLLDRLKLTYPQYLAMAVLWEHDDQTVGNLGEKLFLESSTLTPMLKRLEALKYISRIRDRDDERQVRVQLTKTGLALREKAKAIPACIIEATGLNNDGVAKLKEEITKLRASLVR
jgi:DNA-binding MarR family transcriptional regulator